MPQFSRHVTVDWSGTLMEGNGQVKAGTGAFSVPVSFPRRIGEPEGTTSPEELIAGAHGACFAMVVAGALVKKNASAAKMQVTCTVTADKGDAGIKITTSKIHVMAEGLTGMDRETFVQTVKEADKGCPVSNALRGTLAIEIEANAK
jgi:osmotically inducible protein OsmC